MHRQVGRLQVDIGCRESWEDSRAGPHAARASQVIYGVGSFSITPLPSRAVGKKADPAPGD